MSSVVISGNTSGTITLDAPAVAGTTTLTLPATSGTVVTKDTNGIISVNGVQFPATQSASADANTLDDYEEGTWTPTLGGTATYNLQVGTYTKIGRLVTVNFVLDVSSIGTGSTTTISGLPFTVFGSNRGAGGVGFVSSPSTAWASIFPVAIAASTTILFIVSSTVGAWTNGGAVYTTGTVISGTITYFV
jgi:hypothetical protein